MSNENLVVRGHSYLWSAWLSLGEAQGAATPQTPGLYRLRRSPQKLDYIGQTGRSLRGRLQQLRTIFGKEMPFRDPHTAAPALWALLHLEDLPFEASVLETPGRSTMERKGLEAAAIALYRQETGSSPTANFGRMPAQYSISTYRAGQVRGSLLADFVERPEHRAGIAPAGRLDGEVTGRHWCGHLWTPWMRADEAAAAPSTTARGLYRLRVGGSSSLLYIGEGNIRARLALHLSGMRVRGAQWEGAEPVSVEMSWVAGAWESNQRLELETDLIGAHVVAKGVAPAAQFKG